MQGSTSRLYDTPSGDLKETDLPLEILCQVRPHCAGALFFLELRVVAGDAPHQCNGAPVAFTRL